MLVYKQAAATQAGLDAATLAAQAAATGQADLKHGCRIGARFCYEAGTGAGRGSTGLEQILRRLFKRREVPYRVLVKV